MPQVRATVLISGRVQGVWFRQSTKNIADKHKLSGWVRNTPEGCVAALFEGECKAVEAVLEWCKQGPELAQVTDLKIELQPACGEYQQFLVIR